MKAALLHKPAPIETQPLQYTDVKNPVIAKSEILVRITATGVCRSNLHVIEGDWLVDGLPAKLPIIPGHELIGFVEAKGKAVHTLKVGDRVGIQPLWKACGKCIPCKMGLENVCENSLTTGENIDGGYAEYIRGNRDFVYKVPEEFEDDEAAPLFCAGITAFGAVMKAGARKGRLIAVFGVGGVGHLAVELAKKMGAKVAAVSRQHEHLKIAEKAGADILVNPLEIEPTKALKRYGLADSSIVFAPSKEIVTSAAKATKPRGIFVAGVLINAPMTPFINRELVVKATAAANRRDTKKFLAYAVKNDVWVQTEKFPLKQANEVLKNLKESRIKARAVLSP
jgi:propanol-preferring alcohol dehydrogenase